MPLDCSVVRSLRSHQPLEVQTLHPFWQVSASSAALAVGVGDRRERAESRGRWLSVSRSQCRSINNNNSRPSKCRPSSRQNKKENNKIREKNKKNGRPREGPKVGRCHSAGSKVCDAVGGASRSRRHCRAKAIVWPLLPVSPSIDR